MEAHRARIGRDRGVNAGDRMAPLRLLMSTPALAQTAAGIAAALDGH
ncbi:MAG: hypothetical protein JWQ03_2150, partial [Variovorax sp.]|nr:hypothetical protein [Variovorax sp.]